MIQGKVSDDGVPTIILSLAGQDWIATIDTGFNGYLELPCALLNSLNTHYIGRITSALAGGQMIKEDVYLLDFPFDGKIIPAEATFIDDYQILVGTRLLREHLLQVDFVNQTVKLKRVWIS